jgi:hypothetical protein
MSVVAIVPQYREHAAEREADTEAGMNGQPTGRHRSGHQWPAHGQKA